MPVVPTLPGSPIWLQVQYQVVMPAPNGVDPFTGSPYTYRKPLTTTDVKAQSSHPADILAVLNANVGLLPGKAVDIVRVIARDWNFASALD